MRYGVLLFPVFALSAATPSPQDLIVKDAYRLKLNEETDTREAIDQVMYRAWVRHQMRSAKKSVQESDIRLVYNSKPLVRLRTLTLLVDSPSARKKSSSLLPQIQREIKKGKSFADIIVRYSQDPSARFHGDTGLRSHKELPAEIYHVAVKLKKNEISPVIKMEKSWHIVQLVDRPDFENSPETYRLSIADEIRQKREQEITSNALQLIQGKIK